MENHSSLAFKYDMTVTATRLRGFKDAISAKAAD